MDRALTRLLPLVLAACTPGQPGETDGGASGGEAMGSSTTTAGVEPTTAGVDSTAADTGSATSSPFIMPLDGGAPGHPCDPWGQDCPPGQKCTQYSAYGDDAPDSLKCVDVVPEPDGLHQPCEVFGPAASGEDSCDVGLLCSSIDDVSECVGLCSGSPDAPDCVDPAETCVPTDDPAFTICGPMCNPLLQDCPYNDVCIPRPGNPSEFMCVLDGGEEGDLFAPCQYLNECQAGLHCGEPEAAVECEARAPGCCVPFCDASAAEPCPGQGQECLPWYGDGEAPPGFEDVGSCASP
ncbi:hypothetical protein [Nannocystis punicea]|uniref:Uncharacterized protein n=1 Tax=Nannocystis punicea TaxID=2995304 RepID=A0ABY7H8V6_9BACT|nr:hypothetical protein [Nannocystis poenicansa]WAS95530.1 hypothetical protein O0S08_05155 [Nannocystis poenicansa]